MQNEAQKLLINELHVRKERNASYSLRAFAQHLGFSPAHLSQLISGKRNFTADSLSMIAQRLCLSPDEEQRLLMTTLWRRQGEESVPVQKRQLKEDEFRLISDWWNFAILSLAKLKNAKADSAWISDRLGISKSEAQISLERLLRLNLIKSSPRLERTGAPLNIDSTMGSEAIQSYHHKVLDLAQDRLTQVPAQERDYSAMTFVADPERLPEARQMIEEFQDKLSTFLEGTHPKKAFMLTCQLFPVEKKQEKPT